MTRVLYPGSFDPVHLGHVEIVESAAALFDSVVVAAVGNPGKGRGLFSLDERTAMLGESFAHLANVEVMSFSTLVVNVARDVQADFIVKGLRVVQDFESELQMAQMNKEISGVETLFLPTASRRSFLASKLIREIASFGGDVSSMVPPPVLKRLAVRFADQDKSDE
ncbi:MAG: pantetheine-phosphate adenylyltransferase [Acidimicrobiales bacterium]